MFMLRKKSPLGDLGGILFFPYSASGLPGLFIWKVLALASILKAPNYSVIISNFITINEQIQNIAQKKDTLCRRMYN